MLDWQRSLRARNPRFLAQGFCGIAFGDRIDFFAMESVNSSGTQTSLQAAGSEDSPRKSRIEAYTGVREDIAQLVPADARCILDVGCSNGALGHFLKSQVHDRTIIGIEIDIELAEHAAHSLDLVIRADLEELEICSALATYGPFDCIVCADVLEHLRDPEKVLNALSHLLAPRGKLIVGLPNIRHHSALWEIFVRGKFPRRTRGIFDSTHLRWFTYCDGIKLLQSAALEPETTTFCIRIGDKGGGLVNRICCKVFDPVSNWWLLREFFAYQFVLRAHRSSKCNST